MAAAATATATASPIRRPPRNVRMILSFNNCNKMDWSWTRSPRLQFRLLPHDNLGADRNTLIEVGHVGIDQPEAAGRDGGADRIGPVGAVDTIDGGAEIHRTGAEWIARPAGHEPRQIGLARDHLRRRCPVRPLRLARDVEQSLPLESLAADTDAIAQRAAASLNQIEMALRGLDDDGAGRLGGTIKHRGAPVFRVQLDRVVRQKSRLVTDIGFLSKALRDRKHQTGCGNYHPDQVPKFRHKNSPRSAQRDWSTIPGEPPEPPKSQQSGVMYRRLFRCDPQPQAIGHDTYRADPAEPKGGEPQQALRQRARILLGRRQ